MEQNKNSINSFTTTKLNLSIDLKDRDLKLNLCIDLKAWQDPKQERWRFQEPRKKLTEMSHFFIMRNKSGRVWRFIFGLLKM
jgi:hypothetical protein